MPVDLPPPALVQFVENQRRPPIPIEEVYVSCFSSFVDPVEGSAIQANSVESIFHAQCQADSRVNQMYVRVDAFQLYKRAPDRVRFVKHGVARVSNDEPIYPDKFVPMRRRLTSPVSGFVTWTRSFTILRKARSAKKFWLWNAQSNFRMKTQCQACTPHTTKSAGFSEIADLITELRLK